MKKIISILTILCLTLSIAFAESPKDDGFEYNVADIQEDFAELNKVEAYVNQNDVTLEELKAGKNIVLEGVKFNEGSSLPMEDLPLNIPAFWWGCVLGWIGLLLVFILSDNDRDQVKKALYGCIVSSVVGLVLYFVVIAGAVATSI